MNPGVRGDNINTSPNNSKAIWFLLSATGQSQEFRGSRQGGVSQYLGAKEGRQVHTASRQKI